MQGNYVGEELQEADSVGVGRRGRADAAEEGLGVVTQEREFIQQGAVELDIGIFLEGKDVFVLSAAHRRPADDGLFRRYAPDAVVPQHSSEEPVIRCGDAAVFVQLEGSEGRCIHPEDAILIDLSENGGTIADTQDAAIKVIYIAFAIIIVGGILNFFIKRKYYE